MDLEDRERQRIQDLKEEEKNAAKAAVMDAFANIQDSEVAKCNNISKGWHSVELNTHLDIEKLLAPVENRTEQRFTQVREAKNKTPRKKISESKIKAIQDTQSQKYGSQSSDNIPPPRKKRTTKIEYTPRIFKTPLRDSTKKREQAFIAKNRPYLRSNALLNRDEVDITESNPLWLKQKGDGFARNKDYVSAVNVYSAAVDCTNGHSLLTIQVIANRALCRLHTKEPDMCIKDCDLAVERMQALADLDDSCVTIQEIDKLRKKMWIRKSIAQCHMGRLEDANHTLQKVANIFPNDSSLENDIKQVNVLLQAANAKRNGDTKLQAGMFEDALECYNNALKLYPLLVGALCNRSLCYFVLQDQDACINDCSCAIKAMKAIEDASPQSFTIRKAFIEVEEIKAVILARRGSAYQITCNFSAALKDYELALEICSDSSDCCFSKEIKEMVEACSQQSLLKARNI